jgi:DNA-directed RNA polymerase specialized sigma24 family protein
MTTTDAHLQTLETLVLPALGTAFTIALLLTRDEELAQARVEDAVARLREELGPYDSTADLRARFFRHVVRGSMDGSSSERRDALTPPIRATDEISAIQALPSEYRLPVAVYFAGRFGYEDIARIVERPVDWVRQHLHAGRRLLRTELAKAPLPS